MPGGRRTRHHGEHRRHHGPGDRRADVGPAARRGLERRRAVLVPRRGVAVRAGLPVTAIARPCRPAGVGSEYIISVVDSERPHGDVRQRRRDPAGHGADGRRRHRSPLRLTARLSGGGGRT